MLLLLCAVLGPGCARSRAPSSGAGGASGMEPVPESEFAAALAEARCDHYAHCCERAGLEPEHAAECKAQWTAIYERDRPAASSGARYAGTAAAACIEAIAQRDCPLVKGPEPRREPCARLYSRGHLQPGERCQTDGPFECALAGHRITVCAFTPGSGFTERSCQIGMEFAEGERCVIGDPPQVYPCSWGLFCDEEQGVCVGRAERGEPCLVDAASGDTCAKGSVCDRTTERCVEPAKVGATCDPGSNLCEAGKCISGQCREPLLDIGGVACAP